MANKLLGQHFLIDKTIAQKMVDLARLKRGDVVLEVGPGKGVLTQKLLEAGARVIAVEKDPALVSLLKQKMKEQKKLEVIQGDILELLPEISAKLKSFKAVANIPYYLTNHLIRQFLELQNQPQKIVLMIQKEVAKRIITGPPKASLLSISVAFFAKSKIAFLVPAKKFKPQPKVDSAVIEITPHQDKGPTEQYQDSLFKILKAGFLSPRKTLLNNLKNTFKKDRIETENWLEKCEINLNQRAQELSLEDWKCLTKNFE